MNNRIQDLARQLEFVRHIPLAKIARRSALSLRRFARDQAGGTATPLRRLKRRPYLPRSLFPARTGRLQVMEASRRFTFLGHTKELSRTEWCGAAMGGAEHQLWRMNLHYMEYLEEACDPAWVDLIITWIEGNPPTRRGAWRDSWSSYALSVRVVIWMQELARRYGRLPLDVVARVETSLVQQLLFLERNLETDLGGNHLFKNIKALLWGSAYFLGPDAERWRAKGIKLLRRELAEQVLADGAHYERSASYHCQVLADLLECYQTLTDDELRATMRDTLARMGQIVVDLVHPDGLVVLFNDSGLHMAYSPSACLEAYERLFHTRPAPRPVFALGDAGYYGLRSRESYLVVDCGRIGPDDLPAHGHADVLSFEWSVAGQRIIVDQGVYEYVPGPRRQQSRTAARHNTLILDDADQADFFGAFRCGRRPNVTVLHHVQSPTGFVLEGTHDGFRHLPGAPRHVRRIDANANEVIIRDRVDGQPGRAASIAFLLHPDVQVDIKGNRVELRRGAASINLHCTSPLILEDAVWWPDMGFECPTRRLVSKLAPDQREVISTFSVRMSRDN